MPEDIPTTTPVPTIQPVVIFTTSLVAGISWNSDYANSNSDAFKTLATGISTNVRFFESHLKIYISTIY